MSHALLFCGVSAAALMSHEVIPPEPLEFPITLVGVASAQANSIEIPEHQPGDIIVITVAGTSTSISVPYQWETNSYYSATLTAGIAGSWKIAETSSEVSNTWGSGIRAICARVYRHVRNMNGFYHINSNSTTGYFPAIPIQGNILTNLLDKYFFILDSSTPTFPSGHTIIDLFQHSSGYKHWLFNSSGGYNTEYSFPTNAGTANTRCLGIELIAYEEDKINQIQLYQQCIYAVIG